MNTQNTSQKQYVTRTTYIAGILPLGLAACGGVMVGQSTAFVTFNGIGGMVLVGLSAIIYMLTH